jgi:hypothetical protein
VAGHALSDHFAAFFKNLNPRPSFVARASSEHSSVTGLIERANGDAALLRPRCFLQGSYRQDTAIYTINDVDIVVLCELWHPSSGGNSGGRTWDRDRIFNAIAAPLWADGRYRDKVRFGPESMCVKVDLGIKLEILPVVYKAGNSDPDAEPFRLYRPRSRTWEDGYARLHQRWLTQKNQQTGGNFIPAVKVFKHLRSHWKLEAVSFHIECLLFNLPDNLYAGGPAQYIGSLLGHLAATNAEVWYSRRMGTPCGERDIFVSTEWDSASWQRFHQAVVTWSSRARLANAFDYRYQAAEAWQHLLGEDFFPREVSR